MIAKDWPRPSMSRRFRSGVSRCLPGVLLAARNMAILAAGEDKKEALKLILDGPYAPHDYPAQIVARQARKPVFFLDQAASTSEPEV